LYRNIENGFTGSKRTHNTAVVVVELNNYFEGKTLSLNSKCHKVY
jgi:hypothetical protein